jgi:hypothetical protein
MKKSNLIPALAIAAVAATGLSLPATASADAYRHVEKTVVRDDHRRDAPLRPVHNVEHRRSPVHYDRGHHHGHRNKHVHRHDYRPVVRYESRHDYRPVERYEPRYDYHPVERYESRPDGDVRVRISYDLHL